MVKEKLIEEAKKEVSGYFKEKLDLHLRDSKCEVKKIFVQMFGDPELKNGKWENWRYGPCIEQESTLFKHVDSIVKERLIDIIEQSIQIHFNTVINQEAFIDNIVERILKKQLKNQ